MEINRVWSMPNSRTFSIPPIKDLIMRYKKDDMVVVDAFANDSKIGTITNDIDSSYDTDFLKQLETESVDMVLYDPPYSPRQVSECYRKLNKTVDMKTTQSSYWSNQKKEISRILKKGGISITFSWNSNGIGKTNGFEIVEILLVAHGGWHNDTIVVVEKKL